MSIYFDFEVGETGLRLRRAIESDKYEIDVILNKCPKTKDFFGDMNIGALIELSVLSICMINENKEVVGFMALEDHPNISSVDPSDWEYWIRNKYQRYYLSRNTLFIHFMCCTAEVSGFFMEEALISVFRNDSYIHRIVLFVPMLSPEKFFSLHGTFKKRNFCKFKPRGFGDIAGGCLLVALRHDFCPKLKMRRAVEEDNDDVVEILDKSCPRLKELYGKYYISELIGRHPESRRKIIVADIQGRAVAVMCLNTEINYRKLQHMYELYHFNDLITPTLLEKEHHRRANVLLSTFGDPILKGQWHPYYHTPKRYESRVRKNEESASVKHRTSRAAKLNKVYFKKKVRAKHDADLSSTKERISEEMSDEIYNYTSSQGTSLTMSLSVRDMLDADPFDYDIVNIDKHWLSDSPSIEILPTFSKFSMTKQLRNTCQLRKRPKKNRRVKTSNVADEKASSTNQVAGSAFMIELFALNEDIDGRHAFDMLEAAFELMKDYDYCIIRVPSSETSSALLQHFTFVPTKPHVTCDYVLYVTHRSSVLGKLRVREAEIIDIPEIATFLQPLDANEIMNGLENTILHNNDNRVYVLTSVMTIVGIGIIEPPQELDFLRARLNLDLYQIHKYRYEGNGIDAGFASLKTVIMYPVFEAHSRFFARELMRLSGTNTLLYVSAYRNKWSVHKGNAIVSSMIPLMPRKCKIDSETVQELKRIDAMSVAIVAFSAWFIGRKFTSVPKANITTKIVIIGASRTALGFMNSLLFGQTSSYLTFMDVTLISKNGLPYLRRPRPIAEAMFLKYNAKSDKYLKSIPYTYYVNVIQGKMAEINLQDKYVTLTSGSRCQYDLLFLFFGKQYQHPNYMIHVLEREREFRNRKIPTYLRLDVPRFSDTELQITCDDTPRNVFIINHMLDAQQALDYIKKYLQRYTSNIIVYGATIHAYLCINALLASHVSAENITFIEPFPPEDPKKIRVPEFCNDSVDETVKEVLNNLNIKVYRSFYFQNWTMGPDDRITSATFLSYGDYMQLDCDAFFYYGKKGIDMHSFVAVHKSSLSYDGGIIIDGECRTRDPSVYAAGPHTRYDRRYYADDRCHKFFDSFEVGYKLGVRIRNRLDPLFVENKSDPINQRSRMSFHNRSKLSSSEDFEPPYINSNLLELNRPKVTNCVLPGGLKYLEVRSPGLKLPHHYVQSLHYSGFVMETFKKGYFKLHFNKDFYVDCITCLNPGNISLEKFERLYGLSATVLKNVHLRFSANKVDDFYEYFRAPWAFFLYHDHAEDLFTMSKELFPKDDTRKLTITEAIRESLHGQTTTSIHDDFERSPYVAAITEFVLDWLSQHDLLLPMYLQPWQTTLFAYDLDTKPMFTKSSLNLAGDEDEESESRFVSE